MQDQIATTPAEIEAEIKRAERAAWLERKAARDAARQPAAVAAAAAAETARVAGLATYERNAAQMRKVMGY